MTTRTGAPARRTTIHRTLLAFLIGAALIVTAAPPASAGAPDKRTATKTAQTFKKQNRATELTGTRYRVMTYNTCSDMCRGWDRRKAAVFGRVKAYRPDVIAFQESVRRAVNEEALPGYTKAAHANAKQLYVRTSRFDIATDRRGRPRSGNILMGGRRTAVWAETIDKTANGKRVIFVSAHTTSRANARAAALRRQEVRRLIAAVNARNPRNVPVVYAGDFNSHTNLRYDTVTPAFAAAGLYDGYVLAEKRTRQRYNSYNGFKRKQKSGRLHGNHLDHVYVDPTQARVLKWTNGVRLKKGRLVGVIPSDHSPIIVDILVR